MPSLNVPPTKSSLLNLRRQLAFAEEGYELLEQKRQILAMDLVARLARARELERTTAEFLQQAFALYRQAVLESGSMALDSSTTGQGLPHRVIVRVQHLPGVRVHGVSADVADPEVPLEPLGLSVGAELARRAFLRVLPLLAELAGLQTALHRLSRELQKTQRRCNALSRVFIPAEREAIAYIASALEEREREAFSILKMVRDRARQSAPLSGGSKCGSV